MAGILDYLTGNDQAASPMGALYPSPLTDDDAKRQKAAADLLASMGLSPTNAAPAPSPFGDPTQFSVANPTPPANPAAPTSGFGAGALPFGFAGPGSMSGINPTAMTAPQPTAAPQPAPQPAAAPVAPAAAPVVAADDQADPLKVGSYSMPRVGSADLYEPDDSIPANATPTQGQLPPGASGAPAPSATAPFSLGGSAPGIGDRFGASVQSFANTDKGGLLGRLANGVSALATGQRTDPTGVALQLQGQADNATSRALLAKNVDPATVQAAVASARAGQPELLKALIDQSYGKDKWNVVQVGEDGNGQKTFMQQNQVDGTLRAIPGSSAAASGGADFVTGPDGKQIPIPPGANRKEFIKRVTETTADAATGKATEAQAKASSFAARMTQAEGILGGLQNEGLSLGNKVAGEIPMAGNYMQSTNYQKYKQAASAFITALLRQESGAAINKSEFDRYEKEMFPQPGDDASVVQQKAAMRAAAIQQMKRAAGPGYQAPAPGGTVNVGGKPISWSVN